MPFSLTAQNARFRSILTVSSLAIAAALVPVACVAQQPPPGTTQALTILASQPATHTSFSFDRSMLQFAEAFIDNQAGGDPTAKRAVAALNLITVDNYKYQEPAFYDPAVMHSIIDGYHAAGWKHLVNAKGTPESQAQPRALATDLWLHYQGTEIDDIAVLVRGARDMNLIQVSGLLRPLDLVHLSGHFGIPKVDEGAVMVPAPDGR